MGNLYQMKKGIAAILFHCSECFVPDSEDNIPDYATRHQYCPIGEGFWCKYQRDQATGASTYKAKAVCDIIKPIFSHTDLGTVKHKIQTNHLIIAFGEKHQKTCLLPKKH